MMDVVFYDENKRPIKYCLSEPFDEGSCGTIHRISDDVCLKWFNEEYYYDRSTIKTIKNLQLNNIYKIYQLLYDIYNNFCSYTMKYYQTEEFDILTMPIEYTLENLITISKSFEELAKHKIFVIDLFSGNTIINRSGITIIDVDAYAHKETASIRTVRRHNLRELYSLLRELYFAALGNYHQYFYIDDKILKELFNSELKPDIICKRLAKYKYPIDYINKMRNL